MIFYISVQEVRALVEILDCDGSSDLDLHEWRRFFTARRISLSELGECFVKKCLIIFVRTLLTCSVVAIRVN